MIHNDEDGDDDDGDNEERPVDDILKILLICLVTSLDFLNDLFKIGNSVVSKGTKKYRGSNNSDGGNTEDGVKIAGEVIGSGGEIEFSEELKELLPNEAGK
ncbi:hypothetical protein Tco_0605462 [Tanacetum coccineum]